MPTLLNPAADVASRGITLSPNDLKRADWWLKGPSFFTQRDDWPKLLDVNSAPLDCDLVECELECLKKKEENSD